MQHPTHATATPTDSVTPAAPAAPAPATAASKLLPLSDTRLRNNTDLTTAQGMSGPGGDAMTAAGGISRRGTGQTWQLIRSFGATIKATLGLNDEGGPGDEADVGYTELELERARAEVGKLKAYAGGVPGFKTRNGKIPAIFALDSATPGRGSGGDGLPRSPSLGSIAPSGPCPGTPEQARRARLTGRGFLGFNSPKQPGHRMSTAAVSG